MSVMLLELVNLTICIGNNLFVHTLEFANASGSEYAKKQALIGAKAMAMTAIDVLFEK